MNRQEFWNLARECHELPVGPTTEDGNSFLSWWKLRFKEAWHLYWAPLRFVNTLIFRFLG